MQKLEQVWAASLLRQGFECYAAGALPERHFKGAHLLLLAPEPRPGWALTRLLPRLAPDVQLSIVLYGSPYAHLHLWIRLHPWLRGRRVRWIVASERHRRLWQQMVHEPRRGRPSACVAVAPPVIWGNDRISKATRARERRRLGFAPTDRVMMYCGRFSTQKNIELLIRWGLGEMRDHPNLHLLLCGSFDHLHGPAPGQGRMPFFMQSRILAATRDSGLSPDELSRRLHWRPWQSEVSAARLCATADVFCGLSTFHSEDFGISPRQALGAGVPLIIADWGGFAELRGERNVHVVRTRVESSGIYLNHLDFRRAVRKTCGAPTALVRSPALSSEAKSADDRIRKALAVAAPIFGGFRAPLRKPGAVMPQGLELLASPASLRRGAPVGRLGWQTVQPYWSAGREEQDRSILIDSHGRRPRIAWPISRFHDRNYFTSVGEFFLPQLRHRVDWEAACGKVNRSGLLEILAIQHRLPRPIRDGWFCYTHPAVIAQLPRGLARGFRPFRIALKGRRAQTRARVFVGPGVHQRGGLASVRAGDWVACLPMMHHHEPPSGLFNRIIARGAYPLLIKDILSKPGREEFEVIERNDRRHIADDFSVHWLLGQGASLHGAEDADHPGPSERWLNYTPVSPFHGFLLG